MQLVDRLRAGPAAHGDLLLQEAEGADDSVRLIRFHTPPDFARSGILTIERSDGDADQWIYLPAYHASRRVPTANRGDTWMGTDFTYEDITDAKIERYEYRTIGERTAQRRPVHHDRGDPEGAEARRGERLRQDRLLGRSGGPRWR